jgi:hypothetical protein
MSLSKRSPPMFLILCLNMLTLKVCVSIVFGVVSGVCCGNVAFLRINFIVIIMIAMVMINLPMRHSTGRPLVYSPDAARLSWARRC